MIVKREEKNNSNIENDINTFVPYTLGYNGYASKVSFSPYGKRERER